MELTKSGWVEELFRGVSRCSLLQVEWEIGFCEALMYRNRFGGGGGHTFQSYLTLL